MSGKFYQSNKFKKLAAEWEKKLAQSGFEDAEKTVGDDRVLIQNAPNAYRQEVPVIRESKEIYFTQLGQLANSETFKDEAEKLVMMRRSEGMKIKDIAAELKKLGMKCHRQTVRFIIRKYENLWGIKSWKPEQLKTRQMPKKKKE